MVFLVSRMLPAPAAMLQGVTITFPPTTGPRVLAATRETEEDGSSFSQELCNNKFALTDDSALRYHI